MKRKNVTYGSGIVERDEQIVKVVAYIVLSILSIFALAPFMILFSASISSEAAIAKYGYGFLPKEFSLDAWKYLWQAAKIIFRAYGVTIMVTAVGTVLSVLTMSMFAYGMIQKVRGLKVIMAMMVLTMLFNGGMVSSYYVWAGWMDIKNSIFALLFPNLFASAFSVILIMSYYRTSIPHELLEAARIDGAGEFEIYVKIILPLSLPILATIGLLQAIAYWNDWTNGMYYIDVRHSEMYSIQLLLNQMNQQIEFMANNPEFAAELGQLTIPQESVRMAMAFIGVLPLMIAFPFFQKYFTKGLTLGGVKG